MSVEITVTVPPAQAKALELLAGGEAAFRRALTLSAAKGMVQLIQDHLVDYDQAHPNKHSWPRSNFVRSLLDDVEVNEASVDADGATIAAAPELLHKVDGGSVSPRRGKYLAIPARGAAYSAGSPGEGRTPPLTVLMSNKGGIRRAVALALVDGGPKVAYARAGLDADIWYWLTAGPVTHAGDPDLLPAESELQEAARSGIDEVLSAALEGA